jgi:transposase-like protein
VEAPVGLQRKRAQGAQNRKLVAQHLKSIYRAASREEAERRLADFAQQWDKRYTTVRLDLEQNQLIRMARCI